MQISKNFNKDMFNSFSYAGTKIIREVTTEGLNQLAVETEKKPAGKEHYRGESSLYLR